MATPIQQLQAMHNLPENWDGYEAVAPDSGAIELAEEFVGLIDAILRRQAAGSATIHVSPTCIGGVLFEWEDAGMQHEVEINPDRSFGFLHLNKATGQIDTRKLYPSDYAVVQTGFLQELFQSLAA